MTTNATPASTTWSRTPPIDLAKEIYCYHCRRHHPREQMRQVETRGMNRWRCIKSIDATKRNIAQRDAFGQDTTSTNRADNRSRLIVREKIERLETGQ